MQQILRIRADAAHDAEDALHEERRLHQAAIGEVRQIVEMADVIAFEFEACAQRSELAHPSLDLREGIRQDEILGGFQIRLLPAVAPVGALFRRGGDVEVEGAHVHRGDFGRHRERGREALIERHSQAAPGGDIDDRIGLPFDLRQELEESLGRLIGLSSLRIARVQMNDGRSRLGMRRRSARQFAPA